MDIKRPKVRKDLNLFFPSDAPLIIKVLTDLENEPHTFFYRHVGPEGPKEATRKKNGSCSGSMEVEHCGGQAPALRCVGGVFFDAVRDLAIPNYRCLRCRHGPTL